MKRKFAPTMEFVEEYLKDVVSQPFPFGDKDKNELTLEVILTVVFKILLLPINGRIYINGSTNQPNLSNNEAKRLMQLQVIFCYLCHLYLAEKPET